MPDTPALPPDAAALPRVAWRVTTPDRVSLDGEESRDKGGRWHAPGRPLVYAATSGALATLEFLAHLDEAPPPRLVAMRIEIPEGLRVDTLEPDALPSDWRTPWHPACRECGERWLAKDETARAAVLFVPSAVVPFEFNVLLDPSHRDASAVRVGEALEYRLDQRVL